MNEYDILKTYQSLSDTKLQAMGYSNSDIQELRSFSLEESIYERSLLPTNELIKMGYTNEQIAILREYNGEEITPNSDVYALLATMSTYIGKTSLTSTKAQLYYSWSWSVLPTFTGTDAFAVSWLGADANSYPITMVKTASSAYVNYYIGSIYSTTTNLSTNTSINTLKSSDFPMKKSDGSWAKVGELSFTIQPGSGSSNLYSVEVQGAYAHSTATFTGSIGISATGTLAFSFTPSNKITEYGETYRHFRR